MRRKVDQLTKKTTIRVASLNMNGFGNMLPDHKENKWGRILRVMNEHRVGVLLLQETHLTEARRTSLQSLYEKRLAIIHSPHPEFPTQREGVAIVLNKKFVAVQDVASTTVYPGRALQVSVRCLGGDTLTILCIYAPTTEGINERKRFFQAVRDFYETHPRVPKPHVMAGDFNNIEDGIDRLPMGEEPDSSVEDLDELKQELGLMLVDGWRTTYPTEKEYTFHRTSNGRAVFSRLDRIYIRETLLAEARNWKIAETGISTDHKMVSVQLATTNTPVVGPGRPKFPLCMLKDKTLKRTMKERGLKAIKELDRLEAGEPRTESFNPQTILASMKSDMMKAARKRERETIPKLLAAINDLENELTKWRKATHLSEEARSMEMEVLTRQISDLKLRRQRQLQQNARAKHRKEGERPTKYWTRANKECAPRDLVPAFERTGEMTPEGEKVYEKDPKRMAEIARAHHIAVQEDDASVKPPSQREEDTKIVLESINTTISDDQAQMLANDITWSDCEIALRYSKNGSAPGIDGIPYEVWKTLHERFKEDSRFEDREAFDVLRIFKEAFCDIQEHGVCTSIGFAEGWMCPIYKQKGERTKVANYRPITLLNTDYKLLTKVMAIRL
ncbi:Endonuclease/exonuclease/phosphatase, partial [Dichomitus squalens]